MCTKKTCPYFSYQVSWVFYITIANILETMSQFWIWACEKIRYSITKKETIILMGSTFGTMDQISHIVAPPFSKQGLNSCWIQHSTPLRSKNCLLPYSSSDKLGEVPVPYSRYSTTHPSTTAANHATGILHVSEHSYRLQPTSNRLKYRLWQLSLW